MSREGSLKIEAREFGLKPHIAESPNSGPVLIDATASLGNNK